MTEEMFDLFEEPMPVRRAAVTEDGRRVKTLDQIIAQYHDEPIRDVTITCRVCAQQETRSADVVGSICSACRADTEAAMLVVDARIREIKAAERAAFERWQAVQAALDEETAARLARVVSARQDAEWQRDRTRSWPSTMSIADALKRQREADARLAAVHAKIQRAREAGDRLSAVLAEEDRYRAEMARTREAQVQARLAYQAIDAVTDNIPF